MPKGPVPEWRRRKDPILDDYVLASVHKASGQHHPETGFYAELHLVGFTTREEADEWRRALYRSAHYLSRHGIADVSMAADPPKRDTAGWKLVFRAVDKTMARAHVMRRYGTDRSRWPYDPRAKVSV